METRKMDDKEREERAARWLEHPLTKELGRPKIADLIVHDPDDGQQLSRDALHLIEQLAEADAHEDYIALVARYEVLFGCIECGLKDAHKLDCSRAR